jgi:hypothetical protein
LRITKFNAGNLRNGKLQWQPWTQRVTSLRARHKNSVLTELRFFKHSCDFFTHVDSVLIGHVLITYEVKEFHQCTIKCASHAECKSINYKYSYHKSSLGSFTCELNEGTKSQTSTELFILRTGYSYYEMVNTPQVNVFYVCKNSLTVSQWKLLPTNQLVLKGLKTYIH